jgi:hypothetical protein
MWLDAVLGLVPWPKGLSCSTLNDACSSSKLCHVLIKTTESQSGTESADSL